MVKVKNIEFNVNFVCVVFFMLLVLFTNRFTIDVDAQYFLSYPFISYIATKTDYYWQLMIYSEWMKTLLMLPFNPFLIYGFVMYIVADDIKNMEHLEVTNPFNPDAEILKEAEREHIQERLEIFPKYILAAFGIVITYVAYKTDYYVVLTIYKAIIARVLLIHLS